MPANKDVIGQKFGRWTVLYRVPDHVDPSGYHHTYYRCICDCGTERDVGASGLYSGKSKSCGCLHKENAKQNAIEIFTTHGGSKDRLYRIWTDMKRRCLDPKRKNYSDYGGRGIKICDEWLDYSLFKQWALNNGYADSLSIDRIDNDGNYEPSNCQWVGRVAQANNRRSNVYIDFNGTVRSLADWARFYNVNYSELQLLYSHYDIPFDICIDRLTKLQNKAK